MSSAPNQSAYQATTGAGSFNAADNRQLQGLCLSFHHLNPDAVGSRRFRILKQELGRHNINLDILCGKMPGKTADADVTPAGTFAPFSALMKGLAKAKSGMVGKRQPDQHKPNLGKVDAATLASEASSADSSLMSLLLSFESLPDGDAGWVVPAVMAGLRLRKKYDFIVSTAPPWSSHVAAMLIGKLRGIPVILDDRDPWAGSPGRMLYLTHPTIRRMDTSLAIACYRRAVGIICVTDPACGLHRQRSYGSAVPIKLCINGFDPSLGQIAIPAARSKQISLSHVGSLYHGRSPMLLLEPALALPPEVAADFHFHFVGNVSKDERDHIDAMEKHFSVTFHGSQSHQFCLDQIKKTDVCLLLAIGQPSQVPAKLYEYIGLRRPVLAVSEKNDATMEQLKPHDWAWACANGDNKGITAALLDIHRRWSADQIPALTQTVAAPFSFEQIAVEYAEFIRRTIPQKD